MVKNPNAAGNTGAASGNANPWQSLESVKMGGVAHGETLENKKSSLASKWEAFKAKRAEDKARKKFDKQYDKLKQQDADYREVSEREKAANSAATAASEARIEAITKYSTSKEEYESAKKEANRGEYIKDQAKRVAELLKAQGGLIKNSIRSFVKGKQSLSLKISVADLADAGGDVQEAFKRAAEKKIASVDDAMAAKEASRSRVAEIKQEKAERKAAYKAKAEARNAAKAEYASSKKEFKLRDKEEKEALAEFNEASAELKEKRLDYEKIDEKCKAAETKYNNAKENKSEANTKVEHAAEMVKLHAEMGKGDTKAIKAEIQTKLDALQDRINEGALLYRSMIGIKPEEDIPTEKMDGFRSMMKLVGADEYGSLIEQMKTVEKYEALKKEQAEKVAKSEPVKKSLFGFIGGFFARKKAHATEGGSFEDEDEDE